ncbi:hypothetical protein JHK82_031134 [Glycine max]|nr:hypothetical protein JHK85_031781 [Glycine max]KAG4994403.1 hypothetical protein JHK86_031230 [Glycine max]KAG5124397.1 hypothetical protein JHK82_031134 [Glycine max]KAG5145824.1 hypothetical protein JHK84_031367 [Glycine max]
MDTDTGRKKPRENENLGSPMLCIMGHVDTGKTKLLDCIRGTNVQERVMLMLLEKLQVDKLRGWKPCHNTPITEAVEQQTQDVQLKFNGLLDDITYLFEQVGPSTQYLNTELLNTENIAINGRHVQHCAYKCNKVIVILCYLPTLDCGEGIPELLSLLVQWTQKTMAQKLTCSEKLQCTVLDVEVVEDHGTTIDFVLVNGVLHEGPIVTTIQALLAPHPIKELCVKGLEHAIAGTDLIGTPICIPSREFIDIGRVASIENNHLPVDYARKGQKVAIKEAKRLYLLHNVEKEKRSLIKISVPPCQKAPHSPRYAKIPGRVIVGMHLLLSYAKSHLAVMLQFLLQIVGSNPGLDDPLLED